MRNRIFGAGSRKGLRPIAAGGGAGHIQAHESIGASGGPGRVQGRFQGRGCREQGRRQGRRVGDARRRQRPHHDLSASLRLDLWTGARRPARSRWGRGAGREIRGAQSHSRGRDQGADPVANRAGGQRRVPDRHWRVCLAAGRDPGQPRECPLRPGANDRGDCPSARARYSHSRGAGPRAGLPDGIEGGRHAEECRRAARYAHDARRCRRDVRRRCSKRPNASPVSPRRRWPGPGTPRRWENSCRSSAALSRAGSTRR